MNGRWFRVAAILALFAVCLVVAADPLGRDRRGDGVPVPAGVVGSPVSASPVPVSLLPVPTNAGLPDAPVGEVTDR